MDEHNLIIKKYIKWHVLHNTHLNAFPGKNTKNFTHFSLEDNQTQPAFVTGDFYVFTVGSTFNTCLVLVSHDLSCNLS